MNTGPNPENEVTQNPYAEETDITLLHKTAHEGLQQTVAFLLRRGFDVNAVTSKGFTPVHSAAMANRKEAAEILIENGGFRHSP